MHQKMRPLRLLISKGFLTCVYRAGKSFRNVVAMNVRLLVLLEVADRAERLAAVRKATLELFARMNSEMSNEIGFDVESGLTLAALEGLLGFVKKSMNF
jgi:hypothetical protein